MPLTKSELCLLLVTYPLELVHIIFLTTENLHIGANVNILVITDHFTQYAKAVVTPNQSAKATMAAFWNEFIANYGFPERLLTDQGCNFESQLVKELCTLVQIQQVQMTPYHPETNGQCKRFNHSYQYDRNAGDQRQTALEGLPPYTGACIQCTRNNVMDFSPYHLMNGCKPQLPIDVWFGLISPQSEECFQNKFLAQLSAQLWQCYELADQHQYEESTCQKWQYDQKMRASKLEPSDLCLIQQKAFRGKHKITDCWENTKYVVVE